MYKGHLLGGIRQSRNKKSITLDLKFSDAQAIHSLI